MREPQELVEELLQYHYEWFEGLATEERYKLMINILADKCLKLKGFNEYLLMDRETKDRENHRTRF